MLLVMPIKNNRNEAEKNECNRERVETHAIHNNYIHTYIHTYVCTYIYLMEVRYKSTNTHIFTKAYTLFTILIFICVPLCTNLMDSQPSGQTFGC